MDNLVILELEGDFETAGFRATLEIQAEPGLQLFKVKGYLPPAPDVAYQIHHHWQQSYRSLRMPLRIKGQRIVHKGSLNRRLAECRQSAAMLRDQFRTWLNAESFQLIDRRLREELNREDQIRFLIRTDDPSLQKLPWHEWDFFERYPKAEVALSAPEYEVVQRSHRATSKQMVRVLAILGNSQGIHLEHDRQILEQLPHAEIHFLVEPDRQQLNDCLWSDPWDILFFAGHSETLGETGRIYINPTDSLTLSELKYGLRTVIDRGLQLAIFNSCDGLGLAQELHPLRIPQLIVMREPIADQVAVVFLKYFLSAFAAGEPLYLAERQARERLQGLEHQFPCASWLPIIYQNSTEMPPDWLALRGCPASAPVSSLPAPPNSRCKPPLWQSFALWISLAVALLVMAVRSLGLLQPMELAAYDSLMRQRPAEGIDPRILVVEVTQTDVNQQGGYPLTDATLVNTIAALQPLKPVAIALDMHRFQPRGTGRQALMNQFRQDPRLLTVCAFDQAEQNYAAPPEFSATQQLEQMGFSNLLTDDDGFKWFQPPTRRDLQSTTAPQLEGNTVRRHPLSYNPAVAPSRSSCATPYSLSFQLAYRFLNQAGVQPLHVTTDQHWQFGQIVFHPLPTRFGGYQSLEQADQIMLNYRAAPPGQRVTLQQVLNGQVTAEMVRDRIVLIGYTSAVARDSFDSPYGGMVGIWIHAHMTSQLLSAVLDRRPLIWVLPQWRHLQWGDMVCVLTGAFVAAGLAQLLRSRPLHLGIAVAVLLAGMYQLCLVGLTQGLWLPLLPILLSILLTAIGVTIYPRLPHHSTKIRNPTR